VQKRRPRVKNYSSPQRHSHTHERLPSRAKSSHDLKGQSFKQSSKVQQNNGYYDNTPCLKKNVFASLESLFDLKKPLNLRNVFPIAFHYKQKPFQTSNATKSETHIGSELHVETLFLQSFSPRSNLKPFVLKVVIMLLYCIVFYLLSFFFFFLIFQLITQICTFGLILN